MTDPYAACQQRAAHITYALILRALSGMEGLTTGQMADLFGLTWDDAAKLMAKLQSTDGVPIVRVDGQWLVQRDQLIEAVRCWAVPSLTSDQFTHFPD